MAKTIFILSLLFVAAMPIRSQVTQEWVNVYFNSTKNVQGKVIALDSTGNVIVAGQGGDASWLVVKYNGAGAKLWEKKFYVASDFPQHIAVDGTGNIYLAGTTGAPALLKISSGGDSLWLKNYPQSGWGAFTGIVITPDNFPILTGFNRWTRDDIVTVKYSPNGDTLWARRYNSVYNRDDSPKSISLGRDGSILITGYSYDPNWHCQFLTLKYDSSGTLLWDRRYGSSDSVSTAEDCSFDSFGNAYVVGWLNLTSFCTIKYDRNGNMVWKRIFTCQSNPYALKIDNRNNIIVAGNSNVSSTIMYATTIKYDSSGNQQWINYLNNLNDSSTGINGKYSIAIGTNNNIYLTGNYVIRNTPSAQLGMFTAKYNADGSFGWVKTYFGNMKFDYGGYGVVTDRNNNVYSAGTTQDSLNGYGMVTIKFSQTSGISETGSGQPVDFTLYQNYPNPFNSETRIRYMIPLSGFVTLKIYDVLGNEVSELFKGFQDAGTHEYLFNAAGYSSGVYFYVIKASPINNFGREYTQIKKMVYVK